jgi:hypothetical protein
MLANAFSAEFVGNQERRETPKYGRSDGTEPKAHA